MKKPQLDQYFSDCGANSKAEVEKMGIHVGCVVTYEDEFMTLMIAILLDEPLDNRMGGFIIAEVARLLKKNKKNCLSVCTLQIQFKKRLVYMVPK